MSPPATSFRPTLLARACLLGVFLVVCCGALAQAPTIASAPLSKLVVTGQPVSFAVGASGAGLSYQWKRNGQVLAAVTGGTLNIPSAGLSDRGWYRVAVTNSAGMATSIFQLNVSPPVQTVVGWGGSARDEIMTPSGLLDAAAVVAGYQNTLALRTNGTVAVWGVSDPAPTGLTGVVALGARNGHAWALKADGTLAAWGENYAGLSTIPTGLGQVVAAATGSDHSLALKADGTVVAWGSSAFGRTMVPAGLADVVGVAAGGSFSIAVKADGSVVAWGHTFGVVVPDGLSNVVSVATGVEHVVALKADGRVVAWGGNFYGQTAVPEGLAGVVAIAAGERHSLALRGDGTVVGWGDPSSGNSPMPSGLANVTGIAAGTYHNLAVVPFVPISVGVRPVGRTVTLGGSAVFSVSATGTAPVYQWLKDGVPLGHNERVSGALTATLTLTNAELADAGTYNVRISNVGGAELAGEFAVSVVPPPVLTGTASTRLAAAGSAVAISVPAVGSEPLTYVWRRNGSIVPGASAATLQLTNVTTADAGLYHVTVTTGLGGVATYRTSLCVTPFSGFTTVSTWGLNVAPVPVGIRDIVAIAAGLNHSLALRSDGTVVGWPERGTAGAWKPPAGLASVAAIAAGAEHSLALKSDGTVVSWGTSSYGSIAVPVNLREVVAIAAGWHGQSLALKADGSVVSWGGDYNRYYAVEKPAVGLTSVIAVAAGKLHNLALRADGTVVAWGRNDDGECNVPAGLTDVVAVAAGSELKPYSLALKRNGTVVAWGAALPDQAATVAGLTNVTAISGGQTFAQALKADGTVVAWGFGDDGQLRVPAGLGQPAALAAGGSHALALVAATLPVITLPPGPAIRTAAAGTALTFSVEVAGSAPATYQWWKNQTALVGATGPSLTFDSVQESDSGIYYVVVTNIAGAVTSSTSSLTVSGLPFAPLIRSQSAGQTAVIHSPVTLEVVAAGSMPLSYQWYEGVAGNTSAPIAGATQPALALSTPANIQSYWVRIANPAGVCDSATLRVLPWLARDPGLGTGLVSGASYANGHYFVFGASQGATSIDGTVWTPSNIGLDARNGSRVAYGQGLYVSGGGSTAQAIYVSSDGLAWNWRPSQQEGTVARVLFDGGRFIAVGYYGISTSEDGLTWTRRFPGSLFLGDAAVGNGVYVAVGFGGIARSTDGLNWTAVSVPGGTAFSLVAFGAGRFVAFAGIGATSTVWVSTDGLAWSQGKFPVYPPLATGQVVSVGSLACGGGLWVAAAGPHLLVSDDGSNWTVTADFFPRQAMSGGSLGYGNGRFLYAGENGVVLQSLPAAGSPVLSGQAGGGFVLSGQTRVLSVNATGPGLRYQWYRGFSGDTAQPVSGATGPSFTTPVLTQKQTYWVRVANDRGSVDSASVETVIATVPAFATYSSRDLEVVSGQPVTLSVTTEGTPTPLLQWYEGGAGDTTKPVAGGTDRSLTVTAGVGVGRYWVRATNVAGSVDSPEFRFTPWKVGQPTPYFDNVRAVGGLLIGVGGYDVHTSADEGRTWTRRVTLSNSNLKDVAQGAGVFVAVGERGFYSSPDLQTWTQRNLPAFSYEYNGALSLARGNGVFVAAGYGVYVSSDGIQWSLSTLPAGISLNAVVFDGTRFVAGGQMAGVTGEGKGVIATSLDGVTWVRVPTSAGDAVDKIDFVGGKYLAASSGSNFVLVSSDAATWVRCDLGFDYFAGRCRSVAFALGHYLIGTESQRYFTSADGLNWTVTDGPAGLSTRTLLATSGQLFAFGNDQTGFVSNDAWTWKPLGGAPVGFTSVAYGLGRFMAVGSQGTYGSVSGDTWSVANTQLKSPSAGRVAFGLNRFVALDSSDDSILVSSDGRIWTSRRTAGTGFWSVSAAGDRLFAMSRDQIATSLDGANWSVLPTPLTAGVSSIAYGNGVYVGAGSAVLRSVNGTAWTTSRVVEPGTYVSGVAFGGGLFVVAGAKSGAGLILTSTDGQTWTEQTAATTTSGVYAVAYVGDRFLITTSDGLAYSTDGVTWRFAPDVAKGVNAVVIGNGRALGVGSGVWHRAVDGLATSILTGPTEQEVAPGSAATLQVAAVGPGLSYQWYRGQAGDLSAPVPQATTATFTTPALTVGESFWVRVTGTNGTVDSGSVRVRVTGPPTITVQPKSTDLYAGFYGVVPAALQVEVESSSGTTYQWYAGRSGDTLHPVPGAGGPSLIATGAPVAMRYWVRVTNPHGTVNSQDALVTPWDAYPVVSANATSYATAGLAWGKGQFVVSGYRFSPVPAGSLMQISADGSTWSAGSATDVGAMVFGQNRWVGAPLIPTHQVRWSADGQVWTTVTFGDVTVRITDVVLAGGRFFALSDSGTFATSADGEIWTLQTLNTARIFGVAGGGGRWVAVGSAGALFGSSDGMAWSAEVSPSTLDLRSVTFGAGRFFLTTEEGFAFVSDDGRSWHQVSTTLPDGSTALPALRSLVYADGRYFGQTLLRTDVGLISDDGQAWRFGPKVASPFRIGGAYYGLFQTVSVTTSASGTSISYTSGGKIYRSRPEAAVPEITSAPSGRTVAAGQTMTLTVTSVSGTPVTYRWLRDGLPISGATAATLQVTNAQSSDSGSYVVVVTNAAGEVGSPPVLVTVEGPVRNLLQGTARANAGTGPAALTGAFTVEGETAKQMLVRAVGPALAGFGVTGALADPQLIIEQLTTGTVVAANDDWSLASNAAQVSAAATQIGALPLAQGSKDAAILATFAPGSYRVRVLGAGATTGVASLEIYDTDGTPRLVYLATRAQVGTGNDTLVQGISLATSAPGRSYLIRALGPSLGLPGALAEPQLAVYAGAAQLLSNTGGGADSSLASVVARAGAQPLVAGSRDAAVNFTPAAAGVYTLQVSGVGGATGLVLLEVFEVDAQRAAAVPLAVVSAPENVVVNAGEAASLGVVVVGKPAATFQWSKNGAPMAGATQALLTFPRAQAGDSGSYSVWVTNGGSSAFNPAATLTVAPANNATQSLVRSGYTAGGTVTVTGTIYYVGAASGLEWSATVPAGWSFLSDAGAAGDVKPTVGTSGTLNWKWTSPPTSPVSFTYTVAVPAHESGARTVSATAAVTNAGGPQALPVAPAVLTVVPVHTADTNGDGKLSLLELTRVIELYNTRNGAVRTGRYQVQSGSEDGFAADAVTAATAQVNLSRYHAADPNRDGKITLLELTRVIELYNTRTGPTRTGSYHAEVGTEDGFAPGL